MILGNICVCIFDSVFCVFVVYSFLGWYISGAQLSGAQFATFSGRTDLGIMIKAMINIDHT